MDTNTNIPAQKKVVSVEILHLDELGYGPQGKHTRRQWREECVQLITANFKEYNFHRDELITQGNSAKPSQPLSVERR